MLRFIVVSVAAILAILFVAFVASRLARSRHSGLSIRLQVFLALALVLGAFAAGLGVMVLDRVQARTVRLVTQAAHDEARAVAALLGGELARRSLDLPTLAAQIGQAGGPPSPAPFSLYDAQGQLLLGPAHPLAEPRVSARAEVAINGQGAGWVEVSKPTLVMERLLTDLAPTVLVISLGLGAAAAVAAAWVGHSIATPIEALSGFSERVSRGEQGPGPPPRAWGREVVRLTQSIDSMRRQLEGRPFAELFAADLSHELRNPVAAIVASAEVLQEGALEEPERARRFVARIQEAAGRINRLLTDLMRLARMESRGPDAAVNVDLRALVTSVVTAVAQAEQRERLEVTGPAELRVRAEPTWLERAVANLIDNALIHSPKGTPVRVLISSVRGLAQIRVENQGELSGHVRSNLFARFVTTRQDKGGTGLGLAIVRAVAEAHGGSVSLELAGPPAVAFVLQVPRELSALPS
jgi:two-component system, OmpR family, sensor histidine kinase CreC